MGFYFHNTKYLGMNTSKISVKMEELLIHLCFAAADATIQWNGYNNFNTDCVCRLMQIFIIHTIAFLVLPESNCQ